MRINCDKRQCIVIGSVCFIICIIITIIIVLAVKLAPVPLASPLNCKINNIPNSLILKEQYFSYGYQLNMMINDAEWGFITNTINFNPVKNTYQMKYVNYVNESQVTVNENTFSLVTNFEFNACSPYDILNNTITYASYRIQETIEERIINSLSGIYTTMNVYKNNVLIAKSNKLSLIDTNMQIVDLNNNVLAVMTRSFFDSFLIDTWVINNNRPDIIDNWITTYLAGLVTIKKREYQSKNKNINT